MIKKEIIHTDLAPAAIGPYSQAVKAGDTVYISGQIPLDPSTMELVSDAIGEQAHQVFKNMKAIAEAAGGDLSDAVKLNISMVDLNNFAEVNDIMTEYFSAPFPARACVAVAALPKGSQIEIETILAL